jgi:hypothetical protein
MSSKKLPSMLLLTTISLFRSTKATFRRLSHKINKDTPLSQHLSSQQYPTA